MLKQQENAEKPSDIRGDVKDNRLGEPDPLLRAPALHHGQGPPDRRGSGNVDAVLDGRADPFISAYLRWMSLGLSQ